MLTNFIQTDVVCNPVSEQETTWGKAQAWPQKPIDTDGYYVAPRAFALGNLESVRANAYGNHYDGPCTRWMRDDR